MKKNIDVYGSALMDFYMNNTSNLLYLYTNNRSEKEVMPISLFFRGQDEFPTQELIALTLCYGKVLDVGAGAGSHSLYLQNQGIEVTALEISKLACEVMKKRGVVNILNEDIFQYRSKEKYDTLLFLMNGIGLVETIDGLKILFEHVKPFLNPGGQLLFDSSDLNYYYQSGQEKPPYYYGEITFQYQYRNIKGNHFGWLYVDQTTLTKIANESGWHVQILDEDNHHQYLARMVLKV